MNFRNCIIAAALAAASAPAPSAQEVDLQLQRREDQTVNAVPGKKLVHSDFVINPTPREITRDAKGRSLKATPTSLKVKSSVGAKAAAKAGVKPIEGAYKLTIDDKGAHIAAFDKAGEFYARQSLASILEGPAAASGFIPMLEINDWPELPLRGIVEGFYGTCLLYTSDAADEL